MSNSHKPVSFCVKCSQTLIAGLVDPTPEFKKVMKYIQNTIGNVEPCLSIDPTPPKPSTHNQSAFQSSKQSTTRKV